MKIILSFAVLGLFAIKTFGMSTIEVPKAVGKTPAGIKQLSIQDDVVVKHPSFSNVVPKSWSFTTYNTTTSPARIETPGQVELKSSQMITMTPTRRFSSITRKR